MSKEQTNSESLDDLLSRFNNDSAKKDLDAFEQEALEGFESLGDSTLAREFANQAQARLFRKLDQRQAKKNRRQPQTYWLAAAGVILIAALGVVFYSQLHESTQTKQLAVTKPEAKETLPDAAPLAVEKETLPDEAQAVNPTAEKQDAKQTVASSPKTDLQAKPFQAEVERNKLKPNTTTLVVERNEKATALPSTPTQPDLLGTADQEVKREASAIDESSTVEKNKDQRETYKFDSSLSQHSTASALGYTSKIDAKSELEKEEKAQKEFKKSASATRKKQEPSTSTVSSAPLAGMAANYSAPSEAAYYEGGNAAFYKSLRTRLNANAKLNNFNSSFKANVFINEKNELTTVVILNENTWDETLRTALIKEILQLNGFHSAVENGKPIKSNVEVEYKPN